MKRGEGVGLEQCGSGRSLLTWLNAPCKDACAVKWNVRGKGNLKALVSPCPPPTKECLLSFAVLQETEASQKHCLITSGLGPGLGSCLSDVLNIKKNDSN